MKRSHPAGQHQRGRRESSGQRQRHRFETSSKRRIERGAVAGAGGVEQLDRVSSTAATSPGVSAEPGRFGDAKVASSCRPSGEYPQSS